MGGFSVWHLLIVLAAFVLLFGAKRLPDMARAVGQSARIFKGEMRGAAAEENASRPQQEPAPAPAIEQQPQTHPHQPIPDTTHRPTF
ncbi:MAG: Sec-independent protein translocase subunit TatA [Pseudonocardiaceae bacterium]